MRRRCEDTFEVPLAFVFDPRNHRPRLHRFRAAEAEARMFDIPYGERNIWGATAGMLVTLYRLCIEDEALSGGDDPGAALTALLS